MTDLLPPPGGPMFVGVSEQSPGLYSWAVTQVSLGEGGFKCIGVSDHPYPTHDAAFNVGAACLKAYEAEALSLYGSQLALSDR